MASDDKAAELARQIATLQHMGIERGLELRVEKIHEMICKHLSAERERCARIVEKAFSGVGGSSIADRIRRGEK